MLTVISPIDPVTGYIIFARDFTTDTVIGIDNAPLDGWIDSHVLSVRVDAAELGGIPWPAHNGSLNPKAFYSGRPLWSGDLTFQIYRQPTPSPVDPLRLPRNTVIDLADSGYFDPNDAASFSSGGGLSRRLRTRRRCRQPTSLTHDPLLA